LKRRLIPSADYSNPKKKPALQCWMPKGASARRVPCWNGFAHMEQRQGQAVILPCYSRQQARKRCAGSSA
jgi:hypothetical protein